MNPNLCRRLYQAHPKAGWAALESANATRVGLCSGRKARFPAAVFVLAQLTLVMVQPQRGHSEPCPERQVVPQWEQVEAVAAFPPAQLPQA